MREKNKSYFIFLFVIWFLLVGIIFTNKCFALSPCAQVMDYSNNPPTYTFLNDWDWQSYNTWADCMQASVIITRGDNDNFIDGAVVSMSDWQQYITIWASIFFPCMCLAIMRAIL
jgi:hypothetical protein